MTTGALKMTAETPEARLQRLGISLPAAAAPAADYVPYVLSGKTLFIAGQLPFLNGEKSHIGKLGDTLGVEEGALAARNCALNILAQAQAALDGHLSRIVRCVKLGGFVNATPEFVDHPRVINGASALLREVLGDAGKHARFAVGASSLPFGAAVEIDAIFEIS